MKKVLTGVVALALFAAGCGGSSDSEELAQVRAELDALKEQVATATAAPTTTTATPTPAPTTVVPTTTLAPTSTTTQVPTATVPVPTAEYQSLCVTSVLPAIPVFEAPAGSTARRCATSAGNVVFDFTAYPGVLDSLYEGVVAAIFHSAELFPIPLDAFDGTAQVMVAVWHRSKTDYVKAVDHRCSYTAPDLEQCSRDLLGPMPFQGIGMAKVSNSPVVFEVVFPTEDDYIDTDVSHWLPSSHEWFHVYQLAYTVESPRTAVGPDAVPLHGPIWLHEGLADYVGALISDQAGQADFESTYYEWFDWTNVEYERSTGIAASEILPNCSTPASQVAAEESRNAWQCPAGRVAVMRLLDLAGDGQIERMKDYYEGLVELGWETSFVRSFGRTHDAFYLEFGDFLALPVDQQKSIIAQPVLETS